MAVDDFIESWPYLTADLPGAGGRIKVRPEDFRVEELPLYEPCGAGDHLYVRIEKAGIPTRAAIERLARFLRRSAADFGAAGLKDANAVTQQTLSIEHADADRLAGYRDEQLRVVWVSRHGNKLKKGHLAGNRFVIRIRDVGRSALPAAEAVFNLLIRRGVPNYFGQQRFGARGDNWQLGRAIVAGDLDEFVRLLLGGPREDDPPDCRAARAAFDAGEPDKAIKRWPGHYHNERRALAAYTRSRGRAKPAFAAVDKFAKRFYVSAFQSYLFNRVLSRRIGTLDTVFRGDLAQKRDSGGVFLVEDESAEQARAAAWEISPTGPLFGYRVRLAEAGPGEIEDAVQAEAGLTGEDWRRAGAHKVKGARRALRWKIAEAAIGAGSDDHGAFVEVRFVAPSGCYATALLREITKTDVSAED